MTLPYDRGNAGDLLGHGVLAEFVRWQRELGRSFRFFDLFGREPEGPAGGEVARRVRALPDGASASAQTGIEKGRYCGSGPPGAGRLHPGGSGGTRSVRVLF